MSDFDRFMAKVKAFNDAEAFELRAVILPLCGKHGYGRIMQLVSQWWREKDPKGAIAMGECYGTLEKAVLVDRAVLDQVHEALTHAVDDQPVRWSVLRDALAALDGALK